MTEITAKEFNNSPDYTKAEVDQILYQNNTWRIVAAVLFIGFILCSLFFVYEEIKFTKEMKKCNLVVKEFKEYKEEFNYDEPKNPEMYQMQYDLSLLTNQEK